MGVIGIGTDIIECLRIAKMIERHGEIFLTRVYTPHEIEYCTARKAATQHYAGRFAAKEAVLKALGTGWTRGIQWRDIEVRNEMGGIAARMPRRTRLLWVGTTSRRGTQRCSNTARFAGRSPWAW
jgi:holo-[acyl-carrier-protein] synthase